MSLLKFKAMNPVFGVQSKQLLFFVGSLLLISFPLHFGWEWVQCQPYFVHRLAPATEASMLVATLGDLVITLLVYGAVAGIHGSGWLLRPWSASVWITLLGLALTISISVEAYALHTGRWSYTDAAPRLPGTLISVLPVAQLLVLLPLSFWLARLIPLDWARRRWP